jgi:succinyl-diaminopimelate desuccinylase
MENKKLQKILIKLVNSPSVTGDRKVAHSILRVVENMFKGFSVKKIWFYKNSNHPALYITTDRKNKKLKSDILLLGHVDVVPAPKHLFTLKKKGDILYGRGVADMKGTVAVMIESFKTLAREKQNKTIAMLLVTDEETGGISAGFLSHKIKSKAVFVPDGGDSEYRISNSTRGILQVSIEAKGTGGSTSNAIADLGNAVEVLMKKYFEWKMFQKKQKNPLDVQATYIAGGEKGNVLPSRAELFLDIRFEKRSSREVFANLKKHFISDKVLKYSLTIKNSAESSFISPHHPLVKKYKRIAEEVLGKNVEVRGQKGSHDGRFFSGQGMPVIATRARSGGMHSNHEWVSLSALENLYKVLVSFLRQI